MLEAGYLVKSLAGHDKGLIYVIIDAQGEYIYLSDGRYHKAEKPKKKNIKHVQTIGCQDKSLTEKLLQKKRVRDEEIRRAIKQYQDR